MATARRSLPPGLVGEFRDARFEVVAAVPADGSGVLVGDDLTGVEAAIRERARSRTGRVVVVWTAAEPPAEKISWSLIDAGAADVLPWRGHTTVVQAALRLGRWLDIDACVESDGVRERAVGPSAVWQSTLRHVVEAARYSDSPILLTGETGTGKELVAGLVHDVNASAGGGRLVVSDCTTVVPMLSGSEWFGHERGAFTDAVARRDGVFAQCDGGTLFLDEVGELPATLQAELLRVVQEGTYKRVGGSVWQHTSFRLVCATNRPLLDDVAAGRFRADLYYRIASNVITLPPLRERGEDVEPLFRHFLAESDSALRDAELDDAVRALVVERSYPGNVRDLRLFARRVAARHVGPGPISVGDIPAADRPLPADTVATRTDSSSAVELFAAAVGRALADGAGLREIRELAVAAAVDRAVDSAGGSLPTAAAALGVTARALQQRRAHRLTGQEDGDEGLHDPAHVA